MQDYLLKNYFFIIADKSIKKQIDLVDMISDRLRYRNRPIWYEFVKKSLKQLPKDNYLYLSLSEMFGLEIKKEKTLEIFDVDNRTLENLPF